MTTDWKNKIVFVTGSSSGIGAATAIRYAKLGAKVAIHGRNVERLDRTAKQCLHTGLTKDTLIKVTGDVSNEADVRRTFQEVIDKFGDINILVNNAGGGVLKSAADISWDDLDLSIKTNTSSVMLYSQLALPYLKKNKGNIVNISSSAGTIVTRNLAAYGMAKAAQDMLTKSLSVEWGSYGIRVNGIILGPTRTDTFINAGLSKEESDKAWDFMGAHSSLGVPAEPDNIADAIIFLSSDAASYITGQCLVVDGGLGNHNVGLEAVHSKM